MAQLNIGGHTLTVDDAILSMPKDQQQKAIDEILSDTNVRKILGVPRTDYSPLGDVGRGALKGIVEGPTSDLAGTPGDVQRLVGAGAEMLGGQPDPGRMVPGSAELSRRLGLERLAPQTAPGRVAETVTRTVTNPLSLIAGPEVGAGRNMLSTAARTAVRRAPGAALSGLGAGLGEEASRYTGIPGLGVAGGLAGSLAADITPEAVARQRYRTELGRAVSQSELFDISEDLHQKLGQINTELPSAEVQQDLIKPIRDEFRRRQFYPQRTPQTFALLNGLVIKGQPDLQVQVYRDLMTRYANDPGQLRAQMVSAAHSMNDVDMEATILQNRGARAAPAAEKLIADRLAEAEKKLPTIDSGEVYAVRSALRDVAQVNKGNMEGAAASTAVDMLDDYLEQIPGYDDMRTARAVHRAARSSERYTEAVRKGEARADVSGSGANTVNTLRQEIRKLRENRKIPRDPVENELMDEVIKGTNVGNWARTLSKLGPRHPLSGWGTLLGASATGHAPAGVGAMFAGAFLQYLSEQSTRGGIEELEQTVRRRAPPSVAKYGPPPQRPGPYPAGRIGTAAALRGGSEAVRRDDDALALPNDALR